MIELRPPSALLSHQHCLHHFQPVTRIFWCCSPDCYDIWINAVPGYTVEERRHPGNTLLLAKPKAITLDRRYTEHLKHPKDPKLTKTHATYESSKGIRQHCFHKYQNADRLYWCCEDGCYDLGIAKAGYKVEEQTHAHHIGSLYLIKPKA